LITDGLAEALRELLGAETLYFYDAAAPIADFESIDMSKAFFGSRYGKGGADYINCPLNKEEYLAFYGALRTAERAKLKEFDDISVFEGCMPIEVLAARGVDAIRYGAMKPVGLYDEYGKRPYAVLQLRAESADRTAYNLVGFQTNLTFPEQRRVFGMIPALKNAEFLRYGVMHRNTYVNAPQVLEYGFSCKKNPALFIAGQLSGVEGYCESMMSGLVAAKNAIRLLNGEPCLRFDERTMIGAILKALTEPRKDFQPINANFGLLPPLANKIKDKRERYAAYSRRALELFQNEI
jgi:methylenetetrahydrofolate--tRNA-(uracil-5-)-methyltransferase